MRISLWLALSLLPACRTVEVPTSPEPVYFDRGEPAMGTLFRIRGYAPDAASATRAGAAAFQRLAELEASLSDYDPESELSRLSRLSQAGPVEPVPVSSDLFAVLAVAEGVSRASEGAFDVSVGPAIRLWRRARRQAELPDLVRLAQARAAIGWEGIELDHNAGTVRLSRQGMQLDLGAVAKGYALDQMLEALESEGVERALIDGGGDLVASGPPPGEEGWRVVIEAGIEDETHDETRPALLLANEALATSGDTERFAMIGGVRYSHIIDPRTAEALTDGVGASVLASSGARADAWASALCVLGAQEGLWVLQEQGGGMEGRVLERREGGLAGRESVGWSRRVFRVPLHDPPNPR